MKPIDQWKHENLGGLYTPNHEDIDELIAIIELGFDNRIDRLTEENKRLREALSNSQKVMNTVGLIMLNGKYSKNEKIERINSMIDVHMNDIFTSNKHLLSDLIGETHAK